MGCEDVDSYGLLIIVLEGFSGWSYLYIREVFD